MKAPLSPERWRRVNDLFLAAVEQPSASRAAWLDAQCEGDFELRLEVESLLQADAPSDAASSVVRAVTSAIAESAITAPVIGTQTVGPYRILREIGQGGMATVYLAVREGGDFEQRVAIKVVRGLLGGDALRRFRAERQILASLEHPSIARLLDGGTTPDGIPYLVMEYVDGVPIDQYCRTHGLAIRERLQLFCRVCDAVSHAHRNLVVHRDLKPSNILIAEDGTPKLLDFGIARLIADDGPSGMPLTMTGMRMLTPEYASPEQVRGEPITTAADVYSLGVLLFELLTGQRPLAFTTRQTGEIERVVCTVEPRPAEHGRQVEQGIAPARRRSRHHRAHVAAEGTGAAVCLRIASRRGHQAASRRADGRGPPADVDLPIEPLRRRRRSARLARFAIGAASPMAWRCCARPPNCGAGPRGSTASSSRPRSAPGGKLARWRARPARNPSRAPIC